MIITISGPPGAGKTSAGKKLADRLNYKFYSMGDLRGSMARERGLSLEQLNRIGESEDWTDLEVDSYQKRLGEIEDNFVLDGNLGFYFIPHSLKIFIEADQRVAAERTLKDKTAGQRNDEKQTDDINGEIVLIRDRLESNIRRYRKYYGVDFMNGDNYDLVIDSTDMSPEQVMEIILNHINKINTEHFEEA